MTQWAPCAGWNSVFSAEERQKGSEWFHHLMDMQHTDRILRLTNDTAETLVLMKMYQEVYPGLRYSEDQERILHQFVTPMPLHAHKARFVPRADAPPFVSRACAQLSQPHTVSRRPYGELLSVHRKQHQGQHGDKKEHCLNEHTRHRESTIGQKGHTGTKEALKHPRSFGVRK